MSRECLWNQQTVAWSDREAYFQFIFSTFSDVHNYYGCYA